MNKKKLLALVLAALMSVSTTVVAFADESTPAATQNAGITVLSESELPLEQILRQPWLTMHTAAVSRITVWQMRIIHC